MPLKMRLLIGFLHKLYKSNLIENRYASNDWKFTVKISKHFH